MMNSRMSGQATKLMAGSLNVRAGVNNPHDCSAAVSLAVCFSLVSIAPVIFQAYTKIADI